MPPLDSIFYRLGEDAPWATIHVRLADGVPAASVTPLMREAVRQADPTLPVYDLMTVRDAIARQMSEEVLIGRLTMAFALIATFLAAVGLYGVLAQSVAERRVELGIRAALGAAPARVLRMVTSDALLTTAAGAAAGIVLSLWLGRYIENRLFGVDRFDAATFAAALAVIVATSLVAAIVPASRAARVDPVTALRQ
jgi:ABC-type antimicrobial peptide transport system permease subunit